MFFLFVSRESFLFLLPVSNEPKGEFAFFEKVEDE